jgi:hypothetical protein
MAKLWRRTAALGAREFSVAASAARSLWPGSSGALRNCYGSRAQGKCATEQQQRVAVAGLAASKNRGEDVRITDSSDKFRRRINSRQICMKHFHV